MKLLDLSLIRTDGDTQSRLRTDTDVVDQYAELMKDGVVFPPILVCHDGEDYWLVDGFQRLAAARKLKMKTVSAEVQSGDLQKARWLSYAANKDHGLRRSRDDARRALHKALCHRYAKTQSNVEIARHIGVSEATVRRWRRRLSSTTDEDGTRVVHRGGTEYLLHTGNIGGGSNRSPSGHSRKSRAKWQEDIRSMKSGASPSVRRVLTIIENWALGPASATASLQALESLLAGAPDSPPLGQRTASNPRS